MAMKLLVVCKHPESHQTSFDFLEYLTIENDLQVTVYGVQNSTANKSRVVDRQGVRFLEADGNKLDIDVLHKELTSASYDVLIIMHTVNIVATIAKSLEGTMETLATKSLLYCEIPREFPHRRYFESLKSVIENPKLHGKISLATPSRHGKAMLDKLVNHPNKTHVLPYGINSGAFYAIPHEVARSAIEFREDDTFVIFSIGRTDTSILTFAAFVKNHINVKVKLLLPIDENLTDAVKEFYLNEMTASGVEESRALNMLVLMKDIAYMNNDELNVIACAANVIVHANAITDFNIYVPQFALTNVPQIVPDISYNTEYIDKQLVVKVPALFDFYTFDEYGGKLSLSTHRDFETALDTVYKGRAAAQQAARALNATMGCILDTQLTWKNWKRVLDGIARPQRPPPPPPPPPGAEHNDEIDGLKRKLQNILLKINK
jgi:hypothetical protein